MSRRKYKKNIYMEIKRTCRWVGSKWSRSIMLKERNAILAYELYGYRRAK